MSSQTNQRGKQPVHPISGQSSFEALHLVFAQVLVLSPKYFGKSAWGHEVADPTKAPSSKTKKGWRVDSVQ